MEVVMTRALPGAGKTTWAKQYLQDHPNTIRINKDDLRAMLHDSKYSKTREGFVLEIRNELTRKALAKGQSVIIDDTGFNPIHEETLRGIAKEGGAKFRIKDLTYVPLDVCIERDSKRPKPVGEKIIIEMYNKYLRANIEKPVYNENCASVFIFDIDGTVALMGDRGPFDWSRVGEDTVNGDVYRIYKYCRSNVRIIFVSGRDEVCRDATESWLDDKGFGSYEHFYMRKANDTRKDSIVKREIYEEYIKGKYNVCGVFDDRNQTTQMWRDLGLTCFQVADGNF